MTRISPPQIFRRALLAGGLALAATSFPALAVDYTWSPTGVVGVAGSGTWSTSVVNWFDTGTSSAWTSSTSNRAFFGGTDGTPGQYAVSVAGNYNIQGITINSDGYLLQSTVPATQRVLTHNGGGITIAAGKSATFNQVRVNSNANWGISGGGTLNLETGGYLYSQQGLSIGADTGLVLNGGGSHAANYTVTGTVTLQTASSGTLNATNTTASQGIRMSGNGTVNLDGGVIQTVRFYNNTAISTTLNLNGGILRATTGAASNFIGVSNAYIKEGGAIIDSNGFNIATSQVLQHGGVAAMDGGLTKTGAGSLTLSGISTYTGDTIVNAGSLVIGTGGSIALSDSVSIDSDATFDTTAQAFVMLTNQEFTFTLDPTASGVSGMLVAGALNITAGVVDFNLTGPLDDAVYVIASYTSLTGTNFASVNTPSGYSVDYAYNGGTQIALVAIPEPTAMALLTGGLCAVMFFRRNRRSLS